MRPKPPKELGDFNGDYPIRFLPALDMPLWVRSTFLEPSSKLFNQDHYHLFDLIECVGFLWAVTGFESKGRFILGQTEELIFRAGKWQKWRQEQQMMEWFGFTLPLFVITLDGAYCAQCSNEEFCALVEHELYHIGHALDQYGLPAFDNKTGLPKLATRGHDVEEFIGVVRRYGKGRKDGSLAQLIEAGNRSPEISRVDIAKSCGTCLKLVA